MLLIDALLAAVVADPIMAIMTWVLGALAMGIVVSDHKDANSTATVVLSVLWMAVVPVMLVARLIALLDLPPRPQDKG